MDRRNLTRWAQVRADAQAWEPPRLPTIIVAPHPDDETLLSGGLLARQSEAGVEVTVVAVTDGEAAYPGDPEGLAQRRRIEQCHALRALSNVEVPVHRLGIPDGEVGAHLPRLVDALEERLTAPSLVVAPWRLDHHCDHEAVGRATHRAALRCGAVVAEGFFWTWHHRQPDELRRPLRELRLSERVMERKRRALSSHRSQLTGEGGSPPVLPADLLAPFAWPSEYFMLSAGRGELT